ncbi:DNA cytosine methyltransferase [Chryseobacterium sp. LC2016-27]|uniref:DNA cytosine methyltransferase n=1 Tax=Chryseobacterium sp. LC2016-27 TaxID=2897326 RepID=UPI001E3970C5|nr:DNA cytosine methyltransferase [Chryseobacterium sp. LC2016-27]MCD0456342.1 DNA cytosine methyltransferase [Chryseobacterium sp. LC2016-27]
MKVVSLFSGAGGLDLGFIKAGHEVVWANDNFSDAVKTYRKNIGDHIVCEDISKISSDEIPEHDILIGGFPCQGFSLANSKRGEHDERNKLYLELLRILIDKQPKFFLAENVKGILSLGKGEIFRMIISDFENAGYKVKYKVLNAANYGVPQKRERVIILGVKNDIDFNLEHPEPTHTENTDLFSDKKKWVSIGEALKNIPEPEGEHNLTNHTYSKFKLKFNGYLGNRAVDANKPAPTVTARGDAKGGVVVLHHPNNHRRMSVRELASTQSFPEDFIFEGNNSSAYRQIGNAVPVKLAFAIASIFPKEFKIYANNKIASKAVRQL